MATWDQQLVSRIIRTGDMQAALDEGLQAEDFQTSEARALFQQLLVYFSKPPTDGSVWGPATLEAKFPTYALVDDPSMTVKALCHEVRQNRLKVESRDAIMRFAEEVEADPSAALERARQSLDGMQLSNLDDRLLTASEIMANHEEPPMLVPELGLTLGGPPSLFAGQGFGGKTLTVNDIALGVASGTWIWGQFRSKPCTVKIFDYEQGKAETCLRLTRLARARGLTPAHLDDMLEVMVLPRFFLDEKGAEARLKRLCADDGLVIIDSLRAACPHTDENSSEARRPLDMLHRVAAEIGCCFVVIHHMNKTQGAGPAAAIRGSTAIRDAVDNVYLVTSDGPGNVKIEHNKSRRLGYLVPDVHLSIVDVELNGNARAGLKIVPRAPEPEELGLPERILEHLVKAGPCSKNAIHKALGGQKAGVLKKVDELVHANEIILNEKNLFQTP